MYDIDNCDLFQKNSSKRQEVCAIVRNRIAQGNCKGCFVDFIITDISPEALRKCLAGIAEFDKNKIK